MERPYILHMLTPGSHMSPFDVNMAADAGYQVIVPYCGVDAKATAGLTQDAIFSRGPKGVARTGLFIGGRDVQQAADMLDAARKAMVPPFVVSVFADPSGSYTTAAAMVACVLSQLRKVHSTSLSGKRVLILGGTGTVGRIAGVGVMDNGNPLAGTRAVGIGALAVGNVKYQVQHRLLLRMRNADKPVALSFPEAFELACEVLAEPS